jgi:membrane protease YdiL (CAAX protease family)
MDKQSRPKPSAAVSWFFIIATILFQQTPQYKALGKPAPDSGPDLPIQLGGKYIVGTRQFLGSRPELSTRFERMARDLQKSQNIRKQLWVVPILAELSGREAALLELRRLASNPSDTGTAQEIALFLQLYRDGESSLNPQQRLSLKRYGWIGRLALSQSKPASDAVRKEVLQSAFVTTILLGLAGIGILFVVAAGFVLLAIAIVLHARGGLRSHLSVPEKPGSHLLQAFAIYFAGYIMLPALGVWLLPKFHGIGSLLALLAVVTAILWPRFAGSDWRNYRAAIGWGRGQGVFREIGAGILGYIAGLPLLLCAGIIVMMLSHFAGKVPVHPIVYEVGRGPLYLLFWSILACVWAPLVEETFFRGALFGYFRGHVSWIVSAVSTSILFAIVHPQGWIGVPVITAIGFTLSAIREWRGSLIASMSAHALNNGSALLLLILALQ